MPRFPGAEGGGWAWGPPCFLFWGPHPPPPKTPPPPIVVANRRLGAFDRYPGGGGDRVWRQRHLVRDCESSARRLRCPLGSKHGGPHALWYRLPCLASGAVSRWRPAARSPGLRTSPRLRAGFG